MLTSRSRGKAVAISTHGQPGQAMLHPCEDCACAVTMGASSSGWRNWLTSLVARLKWSR
jgi:hypothetical protein